MRLLPLKGLQQQPVCVLCTRPDSSREREGLVGNPSHRAQFLSTTLPSGRRLRSVKTKTSCHLNVFFVTPRPSHTLTNPPRSRYLTSRRYKPPKNQDSPHSNSFKCCMDSSFFNIVLHATLFFVLPKLS